MARVKLENVTRRFDSTIAVDRVSLQIHDGECLALVGPSGCGKTTLLRLLAGFEPVDDGSIHFDDDLVAGLGHHVDPEDRRVGMVFQSYALWPHLNVAANVRYALKVQGVRRDERERRVEQALRAVGLDGFADRRIQALSGGQRQRVALARCLAMQPRLVLLDEPLANLDIHLRDSMIDEFRRFHRQIGATTIHVTHDQAEAMMLADRIAVMDGGVLQQVDAPRRLIAEPATPMVARFIGRGAVVPVTVDRILDDGRCRADLWGTPVVLRHRGGHIGPGQACLRAADLRRIVETEDSPCLTLRVGTALFQGDDTLVAASPPDAPEHRLGLRIRDNVPSEGTVISVAVEDGWLLPG